MNRDARPNTAELLAQLPPLPDIKRPFFQGPDQIAKNLDDAGDVDLIKDMISGRFLDFMLSEVLAGLPDIAQRIKSVGPAGVILQARASNTINALTVPTRDGVVIIYNLGFYSMLYSVSIAVALVAGGTPVVGWLSDLVDWATSPAKEPRAAPLELEDEQSKLATNIAAQAQRFAMCHELGHVIAFDSAEEPGHTASVEGVAVDALRDTWDKEYAADRDGLGMFLRVLASQGKSASGALIGAELFLNAAGMLQESSTDEGQAHPPPDDRMFRVRNQFLEAFGESALVLAQPAMGLRGILEDLRGAVAQEVRQRRAETKRQLIEAFEAYAAAESSMTPDEKRAAAKQVSQFLLDSPGATLDFLHETLFTPLASGEPNTGSPKRLLALNAALHFEKPLQAAIELPRLLGH
jgi:hypothetical protein